MRSRATPVETLQVLCSKSHVLQKGTQPHDGTELVFKDPLLWFEHLPEADRVRYRNHGQQSAFWKLTIKTAIPFPIIYLETQTFCKGQYRCSQHGGKVKISCGAWTGSARQTCSSYAVDQKDQMSTLDLTSKPSRAANPIAVPSLWGWCHSHEAVFPMSILEIRAT